MFEEALGLADVAVETAGGTTVVSVALGTTGAGVAFGEAAPRTGAAPTVLTLASPTQYCIFPVRLSNHSFAMMPCRAGGAPLKKVA